MENEEALFNDEVSDGVDALNLKWVVGFNKDIICGVHNLTSENRTEIFYTAAHTGVICNYITREQKLLQGHCNKISCCTVSADKRWIVTADLGEDALMVVWDSLTATPVKTITSPHGKGVYCIDISSDPRYISTLSRSSPQEIAVWDWSRDVEDSNDAIIVSGEVPFTAESDEGLHYSLRFNTSNISEIATNSAKSVLFWQWDEDEQTLRYDDNEKEMKSFFRQSIEALTQTVFIPNTTQAVTGTKSGQIVVWDMSFIMETDSNPEQRRPIKIVQLVNTEATFLTTQGDYLVVGSKDGAVRFYDQRFTVEAWFEHINAENILSISFADLPPRSCKEDLAKRGEDSTSNFACPDFIVASDNAKIVELKSTFFEEVPPAGEEETFVQGTILVKGMRYPVNAVAVHPKKPWVAFAGGDGEHSYIYVWNYRARLRQKFKPVNGKKILHEYSKEPLCLEYSPNGDFLCVGFKDGTYLLLDSENINGERQPQIKYTDKARDILRIIFSQDGLAMAIADKENKVALFKWEHKKNNPDNPMEWVHCGSHKSHYKPVTGLAFGTSIDENDRNLLRFFSVGEDRRLIEYDTNSTEATQLQILSVNKIDQENKPTCCIWYPVSTGEDLLLTMNDAYKVKLWNANNKDCRLTCLGPTSGGPVTKIKLIVKSKDKQSTIDLPDYYLAYSTAEKIIGLIKLPLDGNPNKTMGLIGHPGEISDIAVSGDYKFMFTTGGKDLCANMWFIAEEAIERQIALGGSGEEPFQNMIEGGKNGKAYKDMKDFFYYSQIRSKKENTTKARKLEGTVPLEEIGYLMRAMGYYPSQQEIDNMMNEVKYSKFTNTGKVVNSLDMDTLLRVFVNHRPVYGVDRNEIKEAFEVISGGRGVLLKDDLFELLFTKGEPMNERELRGCLTSLLMPVGGSAESMIPNEITPDYFLEKILGFEEVAEEEIEAESQLVFENEP